MTPPSGDDAPPPVGLVRKRGRKPKAAKAKAAAAAATNGRIRTIISNDDDAAAKNSKGGDPSPRSSPTSLVEGIGFIPRKKKSPADGAAAYARAGSPFSGVKISNKKCSADNNNLVMAPIARRKKAAVDGQRPPTEGSNGNGLKRSASDMSLDETNSQQEGRANNKNALTAASAAAAAKTTTKAAVGELHAKVGELNVKNCAPSGAAENAAAAASKIAEASGESNAAEVTPRQKKIAASLKHRRQLLEWIREGRMEAQKLQGGYSRGDSKGFVVGMIDNRNSHIDNIAAAAGGDAPQHQHQRPGMTLPTKATTEASTPTAATKIKATNNEIADFETLTQVAHKVSFRGGPRELRRTSTLGKKTASATQKGGWGSSSSSSDNKAQEGGPLHPPAASATAGMGRGRGAHNKFPPPSPNRARLSAPSSSKPNLPRQYSPGKQLPHPPGKPPHDPKDPPPSSSQVPRGEKQKKVRKRPGPVPKKSGANAPGGGGGEGGNGSVVPGLLTHENPDNVAAAVAAANKGMPKSTKGTNKGTNKGANKGMQNKGSLPKNGGRGPHPGGGPGAGPGVGPGTRTLLVPSVPAVRLLERRDELTRRLNELLEKRLLGDRMSAVAEGSAEDAARDDANANANNSNDTGRIGDAVQPPKLKEGVGSAVKNDAHTKNSVHVGQTGARAQNDDATALPSKDKEEGAMGSSATARQDGSFAEPKKGLTAVPVLPFGGKDSMHLHPASGPPAKYAARSTASLAEPSPPKPQPDQLSPRPFQPLQPPPQLLLPDLPPQPERLPPRRKTQWDVVLEEMRWIATDFSEERKWKMAMGKTLGLAVRAQKPKRRLHTPTKRGTPSSKDSRSWRSSRSTPRSTPRSSPSVKSSGSHRGQSVCVTGEIVAPMYADKSTKDGEKARRVAKLLSVSVLDYWDSITNASRNDRNGGGNFVAMRGCERCNKLKERVEDKTREQTNVLVESLPPSSNDAAATQQYRPALSKNERELGYDEISSRMDASIDHVAVLKKQTANSSVLAKELAQQEYEKSMSKSRGIGSGCGGRGLSPGQLQAVRFLEQLWGLGTAGNGGDDLLLSDGSENSLEDEGCNRGIVAPVDRASSMDVNNNNNIKSNGNININNANQHPGKAARHGLPAIVGGSRGVGKTVMACALLWKNRKDRGPQLIICAAGALIRWGRELERFDDLSWKIYGGREDDVSEGIWNSTSPDVILCDYASFSELAAARRPETAKRNGKGVNNTSDIASLILDLRHPSPSFRETDGERGASPVESVKWWIGLNKFVAGCPNGTKRLVIEQTDLPQNNFCFSACTGGRDCLEVKGARREDEMLLAMRVAFAYHPSLFSSGGASIGRRVVSWARRRAREEGLTSDRRGGYGSVLAASLRRIYDAVADSARVEELHAKNNSCVEKDSLDHAWELRKCPLAEAQRVAYDRCCLDVQGSDKDVASCILKLRKICTHSNLEEFVDKNFLVPMRRHGLNGRGFRERSGSTLVRNSATFSEPSTDVAMKVMRKSSKMRELLRVLIHDCGCDVERQSELLGKQSDDNERNKLSKGKIGLNKKSRVIILATLVETQLLASFFLSALGLRHEILVSGAERRRAVRSSRGGGSAAPDPASNSPCPSEGGAAAWAWGQDILFQFNNGTGDGGSVRGPVDMLVASPRAISPQHGGVCATSADAVISIDEDWSGREVYHVMSILEKLRGRRLETTGPVAPTACRFIKIVCGNTCEDTFLFRRSRLGRDTEREWPGRRDKCSTRTRAAASNPSKFEMDDEDYEKDETQKPILLLPMEVKPEKSFIDRDGFLVPPTNIDGNLQIHKCLNVSNNHGLVGSNITQYRNSRLSSVLYGTHNAGFDSDRLFLPTDSSRNCHTIETDDDVAFSWALFNAEKGASYVSTARERWLPKVSYAIESITVGLTSTPILVDPASVRRYVESFGRSPFFISHGRNKKQMRLFDQDSNLSANGALASTHHALCGADPDSSSKNNSGEETNTDNENAALLVYGLPGLVSRKRKFLDAGLTKKERHERSDYSAVSIPRGEVSRSIFSFCFSLFNISMSPLNRDGNQGCEPLVYFPSFLPSLLKIIQQVMYAVPQDTLIGMKRKNIEGWCNGNDSKKLRMLSPNASNPSSSCPEIPSQEANANLHTYDPFSFSVEANPHSFRDDRNEYGNVELIFTKRLLAADLNGVVSCQSGPSLKSIILIAQKKQLPKSNAPVSSGIIANVLPPDPTHKITHHAGKKPLHKKIKRHHQHTNSSPARDKCGTSFFRNEHLSARSYSAREGITSEVTSSLIGQMRLQSRLNDLVSNSFAPRIDKALQQSQLLPFRIPRNIGPDLLGDIPCILDEETIHKNNRSYSGIALPAGVKASRLARKLSKSLEELSEPWTVAEDSVLEESLSRYGMNWRLAARAVSLRSESAPISENGANPGNASRRSPTECQNRWKSLKSSSHPRSSTVIRSVPPVDGEIPRFTNEVEGGKHESIICDNLSSVNLLKQEVSQSDTIHRLGRLGPAHGVSHSSHSTIENNQHLLSRIRMLKDMSKRRRVATTPIPGSAPTHTSHSESIHAARASMLSASNGNAPPRHDMWPLELLDFLNKNKAAASRNSHRDTQRGSAPHSVHPPSQSSHRQQNSAPYHQPHNVHPSQHHMYRGAGQIPNQRPQYQGHVHHSGANPNAAYQAAQPRIPRHHHRSKDPQKGST